MLNAVISQGSSSVPELVFRMLRGRRGKQESPRPSILSPNTAAVWDCLVGRERKE